MLSTWDVMLFIVMLFICYTFIVSHTPARV